MSNSIILQQVKHYRKTGKLTMDNNLNEGAGLHISPDGKLIENIAGLESEIPGLYCEIVAERNLSYMVIDFVHGSK